MSTYFTQQIARQACYLFHDTRKELTLQPMEFENDGIFVPGNSATFIKTEDLISFSSLIHSIPMAQNDENILTGDVKNPQTLYFYTPMDSLGGIPSNNLSVSADVISFNNPVDSVSVFLNISANSKIFIKGYVKSFLQFCRQ